MIAALVVPASSKASNKSVVRTIVVAGKILWTAFSVAAAVLHNTPTNDTKILLPFPGHNRSKVAAQSEFVIGRVACCG